MLLRSWIIVAATTCLVKHCRSRIGNRLFPKPLAPCTVVGGRGKLTEALRKGDGKREFLVHESESHVLATAVLHFFLLTLHGFHHNKQVLAVSF